MTAAILQPMLAALDAGFASSRVDVGHGAVVGVRRCGQRRSLPPVVLVHGISSGAASWLQVAQGLGAHTEVLAWDAPGYGESTPLPMAGPTDDDYAQRLQELLDALHLQDALLVGHSLGALMVLACARHRTVPGVVLISPARGYGRDDQAALRVKVQADRIDALESLGVPGMAGRIDQRLLSPAAGEAARAWVRWNTSLLKPAGYLQAVHMLCHSELGRGVGAGTAVRVHCGDADVVTTPADCRQWAHAHAHPFALIGQAGHASPVEQPDAVAALILAALQERTTTTNGGTRHE
jgi:pimeloyl-ACP methyl ester carboxylesterase